jgi:hypothetical protein
MRFYILKTVFIQSCSRMCVSKINNVKLVYEKVILYKQKHFFKFAFAYTKANINVKRFFQHDTPI